MYPTLALYIDGRWRSGEGRDTQVVTNPADGAVLGELPLASPADLDEALEAARRGFAVWRETVPHERARIIRTAAQLMRERQEQIARVITMEQGKPIAESRGEVGFAADTYDFYAEEGRRTYGRVIPARARGLRQTVMLEPIGPCAAFTAWNTPAVTPARKIAGALATGCSIVLKAAEETPGTGIEMVRAFHDAGLPAGVLNLVYGEPSKVSTHLIGSKIIRKVSFTGSTAVGRQLAHLCADGLQRITLELGGHAPVIVFDDADLERTLDILVPGKFRNAGQICVSPTRFYVQESAYRRFAEGFAARAGALKVGDGMHDDTRMGPLANGRRVAAMEALVDDARQRDGEILTGGMRPYPQGHFFAPTVVAGLPDDARLMNTEPFGPIAPIVSFRDMEEVVARANSLPYGLAAFAFTQSARRSNDISEALEAGMVGVNTLAISVPETPFGGVKDSGYGSEGGMEGLQGYMSTKLVVQA
ncbi:MAG: NAD-dependent succinate-semialdehyde dehydrogenase [Comamonadaceae bacterium]|nr:MAG: NAD-dependent succinate-semialdehyde dehydrogenase [Comamonadaceae bacterium]